MCLQLHNSQIPSSNNYESSKPPNTQFNLKFARKKGQLKILYLSLTSYTLKKHPIYQNTENSAIYPT
jgi:hypothetical protein